MIEGQVGREAWPGAGGKEIDDAANLTLSFFLFGDILVALCHCCCFCW